LLYRNKEGGMSGSRLRFALGLAFVAIGLIVLGAQPSLPTASAADPNLQAFQHAWQAQNQHTPRLMALPGVVGTALGGTAQGQWAVSVYTAHAAVAGIPDKLDGVPVTVEVTGPFFALQEPQAKKPPGGGGGGGRKVDPTSRFPRPVPIGVSTGNIGECSAGTISCRVTDGTNVYALSNNHVYALENTAPIGSAVLQPGLYDTGCVYNANNFLGTLSAFQPIDFSGGDNTIDAAIAISDTNTLWNATPTNGYGTPNYITAAAFVGQAVQKYGRTTSLTKGYVSGINMTVDVGYSSGTARFVKQIVVTSGKPFIKPGDSGSLLVTNDTAANPVGLLFAGNSSGTYAVANHIGDVLAAFKVTVDGK
jgi:hypothetical protein